MDLAFQRLCEKVGDMSEASFKNFLRREKGERESKRSLGWRANKPERAR
jgi:hypothetical protein